MAIKIGVVEYIKDGKVLKIEGEWYSAFSSSQVPSDIEKGDTVEFDFVTKGSYKNIKGNVKRTSATSAAASRPTSSSSGASSSYSGGRSFPVAAFSPERSIIRQNALTQANQALKTWYGGGEARDYYTDVPEFISAIIAAARHFEAYATGDLDVEAVDAELRALAVHAEEE